MAGEDARRGSQHGRSGKRRRQYDDRLYRGRLGFADDLEGVMEQTCRQTSEQQAREAHHDSDRPKIASTAI
jgi:hypothetical protein